MKRGKTKMTASVLLVSEHAHLFRFHCSQSSFYGLYKLVIKKQNKNLLSRAKHVAKMIKIQFKSVHA